MNRLKPWIIWALGAGFFFCEYFARVDPSVMLDQLMREFHVGSFAIGNLGGFFYYPYILMQIPVGLLVDRFGPRRWLFSAAWVSALGTLIFALTSHLWVACLARFLVGLGAAFAFVGALKLATLWFDHSKLGLLAGLTQGAGMLGAALGEGVFVLLVQHYGWRLTMGMVAGALFLFGVLIFSLVQDRPTPVIKASSQATLSIGELWPGFKSVVTMPSNWANALYAGFLYAPTAALGEFWGVSVFHHAYGIPMRLAGLMMGAIFIGWAVGGPIAGAISDRLHKRKMPMMVSVLMSLLLLCVVIYVPHLTSTVRLILLFFYGMVNIGVALAYAVAGELNGRTPGIAIAFTNMASILIGALLQPVIGWMLELRWQGQWLHGIKVYPLMAYQQVLGLLPACLLISLICLLFVKESYNKGESA